MRASSACTRETTLTAVRARAPRGPAWAGLLGALLVACSGSTITPMGDGDSPMGDSDDGEGSAVSGGSTGTGSTGSDGSSAGASGSAAGEQGSASGQGSSDTAGQTSGDGSTGTGQAGSATSSGSTGGSDSGSAGGSGSGDTGAAQDGTGSVTAPSYLSARIRRLTTAEFRATVRDAFGVELAQDDVFVPDTRQSGFTRNAAQIVDPLFARQLQTAADHVAAEFVTRLAERHACAAEAADAACAQSVLDAVLPAALRRSPTPGEVDALLEIFTVAAETDGFAAGMRLSISALIQSASFIYHTELGEADSRSAATSLSSAETASALSYLLTGHPPDAALQAAAASGNLATAEGRGSEARRLLGLPTARPQVAMLIKEWLGIDAVVDVGKDKERFPDYDTLRPFMLEETDAFVEEVVFQEGGSLVSLLSADYTVIGPEMAEFYGVAAPPGGGPGRVSLVDAGRRGVLNHASFLARYATEVDSAPVRRGVTVGKRVMCVDPGDPTALNVEIVPPVPDPSLTTRERFAQHTIDPECAGCHAGIDGIGFTFENFDASGALRTMDNGRPVETATELPQSWAFGLDRTEFDDSTDLAMALGSSESVKRCFAKHLGRFAGAASDLASENYFVSLWEQLEAQQRDSVVEVLVAYVSSDLFLERDAQGGSQ